MTLPDEAIIAMVQSLVPATRTGRGSLWRVEAVVAGEAYQAQSRSGAPQALARMLVEAGAPDRPVIVITEGIKGETRYRSLHAMAKRTMRESGTSPLHSAKWEPSPHSVLAELSGKLENEG